MTEPGFQINLLWVAAQAGSFILLIVTVVAMVLVTRWMIRRSRS